jgi:serine/threonine protein kinase
MLCAQCLRRLDTSAQRCPACMADPLLAGRYRLARPLGEAIGESSHRATRIEDALLVRVRAIDLDGASDSSRADGSVLRATAARIAKLVHPSLPRMIEHCEIAGRPNRLWLVHEYVRGPTLSEFAVAEPERARDPAWLLGFLAELTGALAYLHEQSPAIAHGQISANTVLVGAGPDQRPYLLDLQLSGSASPAADVRALGVWLTSLLAGQDIDSQLASLIERMLTDDPEHQITSGALREAIVGLVRARGSEDRRSPPMLARPVRPTPRFMMLEQVPNPDGSVSQASRPVPRADSRLAARRSSEDVPIMRPDELSRELSQAHQATAELEQRQRKQLAFARVVVATLVATVAAFATYAAMHW